LVDHAVVVEVGGVEAGVARGDLARRGQGEGFEQQREVGGVDAAVAVEVAGCAQARLRSGIVMIMARGV